MDSLELIALFGACGDSSARRRERFIALLSSVDVVSERGAAATGVAAQQTARSTQARARSKGHWPLAAAMEMVCAQEWLHLSLEANWLWVPLVALLNCAQPVPVAAPRDADEPARARSVHARIARCRILASVKELAYHRPSLCEALWLQIFPQAWSAIGARERGRLSAALTNQLASGLQGAACCGDGATPGSDDATKVDSASLDG